MGNQQFNVTHDLLRIAVLLQILMLVLARSVVSLSPKEDTPLDPMIPAPGTKFCVALSSEESVCSSDPMNIRRTVDAPDFVQEKDLGVEQRIDGNEGEQKSIKEVLKLMNLYWNEEVLSNHDYASIRTMCKNRNELCAFWAAIGECESNRIFMVPNCSLACRFCLLQHTGLPLL